ncbi:MAG: type II toxin-antitoxin system Phd/YefM family antitoxin [Spirochaetales bacterium]|jgi:PHD/YefM family antitoxin component YafN of YafNO toxin-antitoxin module|nr:type II toxin-antitoxin system Phd/YefM family antitoxin [Spirochaetales bacterium]
MLIKPSAAIRKNYNEIAALCRNSGEPVFLTKNGEGDLVVMDIDVFAQRESMLRLREQLLTVEEDRQKGNAGYSASETVRMMRAAIREVSIKKPGGNKKD